MKLEALNFTTTTNVSIIFLNETISLPHLLEFNSDENKIEKSKMNRSTDHNYCIGMRLPLGNGMIATLKIYSAKIEIHGVRPLDKLKEEVCNILDGYSASYNVKCIKHLDITLLSLGSAKSISAMEKDVHALLENKIYSSRKKRVDFKRACIHSTGLKDDSYFQVAANIFLERYSNSRVSPSLTVSKICSIMSNCKYSLGYPLAIWYIATNINKAPGFEKAICIYDNLQSAHYVSVVLRLEVTKEEEQLLWRDNIETTFTIKNTGAITQSNPSHKLGIRALEMFLRAMDFLGDNIIRKKEV